MLSRTLLSTSLRVCNSVPSILWSVVIPHSYVPVRISCRRLSSTSNAVPPTQTPPPATPSSPPPMELPSFIQTIFRAIRRNILSSPNAHAMQLYTLALRNPIARPSTSSASKHLPPSTSIGLQSFHLPDDELNRYRMIGLHLWIIQKVLLTSNDRAAQQDFVNFKPVQKLSPPSSSQQKLIYYLFEHFWADLTPFLKEARGEIKLTKTIKSVQEYFYGAFVTMDMVWTPSARAEKGQSVTDPSIQREWLAAALWRNYFMSDPDASKKDVYRLAYYIQRQMEHISHLPPEQLWHAEALDKIDWLPTSTIFSTLTDAQLAQHLGITPAAWRDSSFDTWREQTLQGQTFDTRLK